MKRLAIFSLNDKVVLKTLSQLLLKTHSEVFTKPPLNVQIDSELWVDINLDMANEITKSIKCLDSGDMDGYMKFISSNYSHSLKELIDFNTPYLLEFYNGMRKVPLIRRLFLPLARRKLNRLREKIKMAPI